MKTLRTILLGSALVAAAASPALAEGLSGTAAVTTNYLFRGITQTLDKPTIQASIGYDFGNGFSVGAWGSGIDFGDGESTIESDYYANYALSLSDEATLTFGATYYAYPTSQSDWDYDYFEASAVLSYNVGFATLNGSIWYSPEFFGGAGDAWYFSGGATVPITDWLSASGSYGYQTVDTPFYFITKDTYSNWNLGVTGTYEKFSLNVMYSQTDLVDVGGLADAKLVATLSAAF